MRCESSAFDTGFKLNVTETQTKFRTDFMKYAFLRYNVKIFFLNMKIFLKVQFVEFFLKPSALRFGLCGQFSFYLEVTLVFQNPKQRKFTTKPSIFTI